MDEKIIQSLEEKIRDEAYARKMGIRLLKVEPGHAVVEMKPQEDTANIFGMTHGGAIFSLIDEAFQISCNSHGTVAVALNVSVTYHQAPDRKSVLRAESKEVHRSNKTATYEIKVIDEEKNLIASCMALAYRKKEALPFLEKDN
jgi:acyl-CoA thioesterase